MCPKYSSTEIVECSKNLIIEIGFGENTQTKPEKSQRSENLSTPQLVKWKLDPVDQRNQKKSISVG